MAIDKAELEQSVLTIIATKIDGVYRDVIISNENLKRLNENIEKQQNVINTLSGKIDGLLNKINELEKEEANEKSGGGMESFMSILQTEDGRKMAMDFIKGFAPKVKK